ncbi:MAG: flagellar hook assembly protein FlgD [Chloroflexi bacterium]|nr:flagellar hook assembly protein FlgD [Chloroflexota bacterium]
MTGSAIGATSAASSPSVTASTLSLGASSQLGKQDFLKLLVAQLRNQDPMKPMEDKEFIAQLAQFSSLEALQSVDQRLQALSSAQSLEQAAALIGKQVLANLADGSQLQGAVTEVRVVGGTPRLVVNGQTIGLDQVANVSISSQQ